MKNMIEFIKVGLVAILFMLPTFSSADEIQIVNDSTIVVISASAERRDSIKRIVDSIFYVKKLDAITKISRVNRLVANVSVFVNGCKFDLGENGKFTNPFSHVITVRDTVEVMWGAETFKIVKRQEQPNVLPDNPQVAGNDSISSVSGLRNEKFLFFFPDKHTAGLLFINIICIGIIVGLLIDLKILSKNQSGKDAKVKKDSAKPEDVGGTEGNSEEVENGNVTSEDESGKSENAEDLDINLSGESEDSVKKNNTDVAENARVFTLNSKEQKKVTIKLDQDIKDRLIKFGIKIETQYIDEKKVKELIRQLVLPTYEDFKKVIESPTGYQKKALAEYVKSFLKKQWGTNVDDTVAYSDYVFIKSSEYIDFINKQLGTNYRDIESLKADLNKDAVSVVLEENKPQEEKTPNKDGKQEPIENVEKEDNKTSGEVEQYLSFVNGLKKTYQTEDVDKLEEAIRNAVIESIIKGIGNEKLEGARKIVTDEMIGNIKECSNAEDLSDSLNQLIEELVKKVSAIQGEIESQKTQIEEIEEKRQQAEEDRSKVLEKISSAYQAMFGKHLTSEDKNVVSAFENFAEKAKVAINEVQNRLEEAQTSLESEKTAHREDVGKLKEECEQKEQRIRDISKECMEMVSATFNENICESIESTCGDESSDIAEKFMQFVPQNDGYTLEQFKKEFNEILENEDNDFDKVKAKVKKLFESALDSNSWIHGLARMFLYVQQPEIAKLFENSEVSTIKITRAFILTEQLLREVDITLTYPGLFKDVYDEEKYTIENLSDIDRIVGVELVKKLVGNRKKLLIDMHRVGFESNGLNSKPMVSSFN